MNERTIEQTVKEFIPILKLSNGPENTPKFAYKAQYYGQACYIMHKCNEKSIKVMNNGNVIYIFSKRKLWLFEEIIKESLTYVEKPFPVFEGDNTISIHVKKTLLCVYSLHKNMVYVTENHLPELICEIYKRNLPRPKEFRIFNKKSEMISFLEENENICV